MAVKEIRFDFPGMPRARVLGAKRQELVEGLNGLTGLFSKSYSRLDFDYNTTPNQL
jgi:hypothetical protein